MDFIPYKSNETLENKFYQIPQELFVNSLYNKDNLNSDSKIMYVNYYDREIKKDDENSTVGILLSTLKNKTVVKYTLPEDNKNIFSSQYKLHLPTEKELIDAIEEEKTNLRLNNDDK